MKVMVPPGLIPKVPLLVWTYVAISNNVPQQNVRTWVSRDVDVTVHREDHACVCADLRLECHVADRRARGERLREISAHQQAFHWATDVHTHAASLQAWMHRRDSTTRTWRKAHLSEATKKLIIAKKYHRRRLLDVRSHLRKALLRLMFETWSARAPCHADIRPWMVQCDRLIAWHSWVYGDLTSRVVTAVRSDDKQFYEQLASEAGRAAEHSPAALWTAIRHVYLVHATSNDRTCAALDLHYMINFSITMSWKLGIVRTILLCSVNAMQPNAGLRSKSQ